MITVGLLVGKIKDIGSIGENSYERQEIVGSKTRSRYGHLGKVENKIPLLVQTKRAFQDKSHLLG